MSSTSVVAKLCRDSAPLRPVSRAGPGQGVGDFVQQHLVDVIVAFTLREVSRQGDASLRMIALTKARFRVVKSKRPALTVEMQTQECVCPHGDAVEVGHGHRLEGLSQWSAKHSTALRLTL